MNLDWDWGVKKWFSFTKKRENFLEKNGDTLHEELITTFNGKHKVPIRILTAEELIRATNNFIHPIDRVYHKDFGLDYYMDYGVYYRGSLEQCPICVKKIIWSDLYRGQSDESIHDIVISSQMSHHKNVWKLIGCCLGFELPALVYQYDGEGGFDFLGDLLDPSNENGRRISSWTSRLRIANDIANAIVYLHMAFPTPIIHRNIKHNNVVIDQHGVAKLFDFSISIALPPGELQVEGQVKGTLGYLDPENFFSDFVSQKTDVYSFGVLLLVLLTGQKPVFLDHEDKFTNIVDRVNDYVQEDRLNEVIDSKISYENGQEQQIHAFVALALKCVQKGVDRPEMIELARELRQLARSSH